jgi:small subunit ribosomal protein S7
MRKRRAQKRYIKPDPKYNDLVLAKFINAIMYDGEKSVARRVVYDSFQLIEDRTKKPAIEVFNKALSNVQPYVEVRSRRVGGATYQVPMEVRPERRLALAFRWLKTYARARNDKSMAAKLASELSALNRGQRSSIVTTRYGR